MSIVALDKITLCGLLAEKRPVLEGLQAIGRLHLISLRPAPKEPETALSARAEDAYKALRFLADTPVKRHQLTTDPAFDIDAVARQALAIRQQMRELGDRRDLLIKHIRQLEPWGDFRLPPADEFGGLQFWFYIVPLHRIPALQTLELPWQMVHKDHRFGYVVVMAKQEPPAHALPVPRTHTGMVPLHELRRQLERTEIELDDAIAEREALTRWIVLLRRNLARAEDAAALTHAAEQTFDTDGFFTVQGWLPRRDVDTVAAFANARGLALLVERPEPGEIPPTLLENPKTLAGAQDVMGFYQTPNYYDWDPSLLTFCCFALFFAMILSDAGYAAVLGLLLLTFWRRLGTMRTGRRLRLPAVVLVTSALAWGMAAGSYFGQTPAEHALLQRFKIIDMKNFDAMMQLSILIGVLHLTSANAALARRRWGRSSAWAPLGWIAALFGGYALWLHSVNVLPAVFGPVGVSLLSGGLLAVFIFSSDRPIKQTRDWLWRAADGLKGLAGVTAAFGDVMSYLRLFALGLASVELASTFNRLAAEAAAAAPGTGLLPSLLILLVGHGVNLLLTLMGGVIHGLRLNFIEFFKWGLTEEGYPFRAFAKREWEE